MLGRPIYSYYIGLLGFWPLFLFYNWNGLHHLVGGPVPTWAVTASIVASVMMVIPVAAVAVNYHMTTRSHFYVMRYSPTLRFVVFGAICYTAVSLQGSTMALRSVQEFVHFTHRTPGHAHLGVYMFMGMIMFGAMYYIMPRVAHWEWPYPRLIKLHFWLVAVGAVLHVGALMMGGVYEGYLMNEAARPFTDVVNAMKPTTWVRSIGGAMMVLGHFVFAYHFALMVHRMGPRRIAPAWLRRPEAKW